MADRRTIRVRDLHDRRNDEDYSDMTPAERLGIMWQLAVQAYGPEAVGQAESETSRNTVRVFRKGDPAAD